MAIEVKKEAKSDLMTQILTTQTKLEKLLKKVRRTANTYTGIPGQWTDIMMEIVGDSKQGMMQQLSAVHSAAYNLPGISSDSKLQKLAANIYDEFQALQELQNLIVTETYIARSKEQLGAVLDEIKRKCDLIKQDIQDVRTAVANVASAL